MKYKYTLLLTVSLPFLLILSTFQSLHAQTCPDGSPQGGTAFDTTIAFASGVTSTEVNFPKFNPLAGMVTCVRLCITITGVVDTLAMQNFASTAQSGTFNYVRHDTISGPGLSTPLTNGVNQSYGPFPLTPYDGVPGAGTDFYSQSHDTILNAQLCRTLSDSATIAQFYGIDSVAYNYTIDVTTGAVITGGSSSSLVLTSALVNFHFEYCTCPPLVLPINISSFNVDKVSDTKAQIKWTGYDDMYANYHYETEMSRNRINFSTIGVYPKNSTNDPYMQLFTAPNGEEGSYYFRIKQVYSNGYVRYSNIKHVILGNSDLPKFSIYPNPSTGKVGIKFDDNSAGRFNIQIYNTQGQMIVKKDIVATGGSYVQVATLTSGAYWLRVKDEQSEVTCVNQLLIK
jgi:hypothetical protein